jgi:hypothetical protein
MHNSGASRRVNAELRVDCTAVKTSDFSYPPSEGGVA